MNLERLEALINTSELKKLNILLIGLGGVGGYTLESLVRLGINNITIVDGDIIESSNLNRQLISTNKNIGKYKTKEWKKRIKLINKDAKINIITKNVTLKDIENINSYDYIIDATDDTEFKTDLIEYVEKNKLKLISCMGTAKKLDATKLKITTLDKTENDPLAKKIKQNLKKRKITSKTKVITSNENSIKTDVLGSTSYVPAVAGLLITNEIVNSIIRRS